jgi:hypothetical protein
MRSTGNPKMSLKNRKARYGLCVHGHIYLDYKLPGAAEISCPVSQIETDDQGNCDRSRKQQGFSNQPLPRIKICAFNIFDVDAPLSRTIRT